VAPVLQLKDSTPRHAQESAALRDFNLACDRLGSIASKTIGCRSPVYVRSTQKLT
jgi:hypothetical protein